VIRFLLIIIGSSALYYFTNNILLAAGAFLLLTFLLVWNSQFDIARRYEAINQAKGNIEDAFQKRYNILTKIYDTTKGYILFKEQELEEITGLFRSLEKPSSGYKEKFKLQNQVKNILVSYIGSLRDTNVGDQFDVLNRSINEVEENLSASRRFYNHAVKEYNTSLKTFPTFIMAKLKGHQEMSYFEVENEDVKKDINLKFD